MGVENIIKSAFQDSESITYRHMLSVLNTMLRYEEELLDKPKIKILDAGCGHGKMLCYLHKYLPIFNKEKEFLLYGYDVADHGVQENGYMESTFDYLKNNVPDVDWSSRIKLIKSDDAWPFEDNYFDIVISNQVLEHVWNHDQFFSEQARVLNHKGFSHHIFPVKEVFLDWHIFLPAVHKLNGWDAIYSKIKFYSQLGLGVYPKTKKDFDNNLDNFARVWADKIYHYCNYKTYKELASSAKKAHLCITTRFTFDFYIRKLRESLGIKQPFIYKNRKSSKVAFYFLKHISSVSLVLFKGEYSSYRKIRK